MVFNSLQKADFVQSEGFRELKCGSESKSNRRNVKSATKRLIFKLDDKFCRVKSSFVYKFLYFIDLFITANNYWVFKFLFFKYFTIFNISQYPVCSNK